MAMLNSQRVINPQQKLDSIISYNHQATGVSNTAQLLLEAKILRQNPADGWQLPIAPLQPPPAEFHPVEKTSAWNKTTMLDSCVWMTVYVHCSILRGSQKRDQWLIIDSSPIYTWDTPRIEIKLAPCEAIVTGSFHGTI